jgi:hypothetical protein
MIEGMRSFIREDNNGNRSSSNRIINPAIRAHFHLEIKTLQNAPRDPPKLEQIIRAKEKENNEKARHIEDIQRLVTEIEILKFVLFIVGRNNTRSL